MTNEDMTLPDSSATRASDLMRQSFGAIAAKDLDGLARLWDDQTVADFIALNRQFRGVAELRDLFAEVFTALTDMRFTVEAVHDVSETVAVGQWRLQGVFSGGRFQGIDPTGRPIDLRGVDVMAFVDGSLRHNTVYYDGLSFARQIGMLPTEGSGTDRAILSIFNATTTIRKTVAERLK